MSKGDNVDDLIEQMAEASCESSSAGCDKCAVACVTAKDVLEAGKRYLIDHGWTKRTFHNPKTGCVCAVGAVRIAAEDLLGLPRGSEPMHMALLALNNAVPEGVRQVAWEFNDAPDTTLEDVLAMFDRAIKLEENRVWSSGAAK